MLYLPGSLQQGSVTLEFTILMSYELGKDLSKDPIHSIDVVLEESPVYTRKTALLEICKQKNSPES